MSEESWAVTGPQVIDIDEARALRIQLVGGRVDVVTHDLPGVRIEVPVLVGLVYVSLALRKRFTHA